MRKESLKKSWAQKDGNSSTADSLHVKCCGEVFSSSFSGAFELITEFWCLAAKAHFLCGCLNQSGSNHWGESALTQNNSAAGWQLIHLGVNHPPKCNFLNHFRERGFYTCRGLCFRMPGRRRGTRAAGAVSAAGPSAGSGCACWALLLSSGSSKWAQSVPPLFGVLFISFLGEKLAGAEAGAVRTLHPLSIFF